MSASSPSISLTLCLSNHSPTFPLTHTYTLRSVPHRVHEILVFCIDEHLIFTAIPLKKSLVNLNSWVIAEGSDTFIRNLISLDQIGHLVFGKSILLWNLCSCVVVRIHNTFSNLFKSVDVIIAILYVIAVALMIYRFVKYKASLFLMVMMVILLIASIARVIYKVWKYRQSMGE